MSRVLIVLLLAIGLGTVIVVRRARTPDLPPPRPYSVGEPLTPGRVKPKVVFQNGCGLLLTPDGSLWAWGGGMYGWGYRPDVPRWPCAVPQRFASPWEWGDVATGGNCGLGIQSDGSLWVWGTGAATLVGGDGGTARADSERPRRVGTNTHWTAVAAGAGHGVALRRDGTVWCWGQNAYGEVGDGTSGEVRRIPAQALGQGYVRIAAGAFSTFAQKGDGSVWAWGSSGVGSTNAVPAPVGGSTVWREFGAGQFHFAGIRSDGTLWLSGGNSHLILKDAPGRSLFEPAPLGTRSDWVQLITGGDHLLARRADGTWWGFGSGAAGQLGGGTPLSGPAVSTAVASGRVLIEGPALGGDAAIDTSVVLAPDGVLWSWGVRPGQGRPEGLWRVFRDRYERLTHRLGLPHALRLRPLRQELWFEPRPLWTWRPGPGPGPEPGPGAEP